MPSIVAPSYVSSLALVSREKEHTAPSHAPLPYPHLDEVCIVNDHSYIHLE